MNAKISVIVPIYNTGAILRKTLKSIQNQVYKNFECLLIDDGSTNTKTIRILEEFAKNDERFIVFKKVNEGIEKTRLFGISKSSTDLVLFCDHDDYYDLTAFKTLIDAYEKSKADIIVGNCWYQRFYYTSLARKKVIPCVDKETIVDEETIKIQFIQNFFGINIFPVSTWGKLYKKCVFTNAIQCFGVNFMEDVLINLQVFNNAKSAHFIPDVIYTHVYGGLSSNFNFENVNDGYDRVYQFRKEHLINNNLDFKPLLVEYKNVVNQGIDLLIDYQTDSSDFRKQMNLVVGKDIFRETLMYLPNDQIGVYFNLLRENEIDKVYKVARSKYGLKRKAKHIIKSLVKKM